MPGLHKKHACDDDAPKEVENVPAGHMKQEEFKFAAFPVLYFPEKQGMHILPDDAPYISEYVPASHAKHTVKDYAPDAVANVPDGQFEHKRIDDASDTVE